MAKFVPTLAKLAHNLRDFYKTWTLDHGLDYGLDCGLVVEDFNSTK